MKTKDLFDVTGLSVVVTGGASGIGLGMAQALAENGARVTIADIACGVRHIHARIGRPSGLCQSG